MNSAPAPRKYSRWMLAVIMGLPVAVMIAADLLWLGVSHGKIDIVNFLGTRNQGVLISPPVPVDSLKLTDSNGNPLVWQSSIPQKWTFLIPGIEQCNEKCRNKLWETRQIHTALGKNANNAQRVYLNLGKTLSSEFVEYLGQEHKTLTVMQGNETAFAEFAGRLSKNADPVAEHWYFVVDPNGLVMMYYTPDKTYKQVIKDMKILLSVSTQH